MLPVYRRPALSFIVLLALVPLISCAPGIPNKIAADEYALYSQWTEQHFKGKPPDHLYFFSRTFIFDPLESYGCGDSLHARDGVSWSLIKRLHELGQAEYPVDFYQPGNLKIPWSYKELDTFPDEWRTPYREIGFSRVAFNRNHTEALFAFSSSCAPGECGGGGAQIAKLENGQWVFHSTSCFWVY